MYSLIGVDQICFFLKMCYPILTHYGLVMPYGSMGLGQQINIVSGNGSWQQAIT